MHGDILQTQPAAVDVEAATAAVEQELDAQEWNIQEIERLQQEQVRMPLCCSHLSSLLGLACWLSLAT